MMMTAQDIGKLSNLYLIQGIALIIVMMAIVGLLDRFTSLEDFSIPMFVSGVFSFVLVVAEAIVWKQVATKSPESLPTYFTAASGFRLLLALATMFVYYLVAGSDVILTFFLVFMAFYVTLLIYHSIFFAKVSNRS